MRLLKDYWGGITDENIIKYRPEYDKMITSQYMWYEYLSKKGAFSVLN